MDARTRREALRTLAAGLCGLGAGCADDAGSSGRTTDRDATATAPATASRETKTGAAETETPPPFPPDIDERVDATPPGSPALNPAGEWPSHRFDAGNTGANTGGSGLRDGETHWRLDGGGPPVVAGGTLYNVHSRDRSTKRLTARDPATAAVRWSRPLVQHAVNEPVVVADGRVVVTTFAETFCFDAETGERLWHDDSQDGIQAPPTVRDGCVLVNGGGHNWSHVDLRAFDAATGEELWTYQNHDRTDSAPAVGSDRAFVCTDRGLRAIDLASGAEAYAVEEVADNLGTPVVRDGTVYAPDDSETGVDLVALDAADGSVRWRTAVASDEPPVVTDDAVYARGPDGPVALDPADGSVVATGTRHARPLALAGDVLYAAGDGSVFALTADDLARLWSVTTEEVAISDTVGQRVYGVIPVEGAVYVAARDAFYGIGPAR